MFIKICGITNLADARAAVDAGADALGFMFYRPSKRFIEPMAAREIIEQMPANVAKVGVFVNPSAAEAREARSASGIDTIQFHGEEAPEFCAMFRPSRIWKAFRIKDATSLAELGRYSEADGWLLDSHVAGSHGGTGQGFDWSLAVAAKKLGRPIIVAGGLNPENVTDAVVTIRPFGLDVSSGVESAPGKKDAAKIAEFIRMGKAAAR
ncbi:phosphoribosylanthranilate isomerase [bacterium]|nr:phosphoribosylanthranilate isomerase [bacterium]